MMRTVKGMFIPIVVLLIWVIGSALQFWNSFIIPSPMQAMEAAQQLIRNGLLFKHITVSMYRVFWGFFLSFCFAFPLGILLGMNNRLMHYLEPMLEFIRHIPPLAMIPMLILWFGIGETSKLAIIILTTFFPIFFNTLHGVMYCDKKLLEVGESFGFNSWYTFWKIIFPAALPQIFVGMRLGLGYSWRALIGAELIAASSGIGYMILDAEQLSRSDIIVVGILTIGIVGSFIDYGFFKITGRFTGWREGEEATHGWS